MSILDYPIAFWNMEFAEPEMLWLFLLFLPWLAWVLFKELTKPSSVSMSTIPAKVDGTSNAFSMLRWLERALLIGALAMFILSAARPKASATEVRKLKENIVGIDMIMAVDASTSMLARDFEPNRLEVAKDLGWQFVQSRPNDRVGLVMYAGEALTLSPLTTDRDMIRQQFQAIQTQVIQDGTAIGTGLLSAINRLEGSKAKSKVIILLTDGVNMGGKVDPETAGDLAAMKGIRVYTIGVGTNGTAPYPANYMGHIVYQRAKVEIDEDLLKKIASKTGGEYFRAVDEKSLENVYKRIDELETSIIDEQILQTDPPEQFHGLLAMGILFLLASWGSRSFLTNSLTE